MEFVRFYVPGLVMLGIISFGLFMWMFVLPAILILTIYSHM